MSARTAHFAAFTMPRPAYVPETPAEKASHREELQRALANFAARGRTVQRLLGPPLPDGREAAPQREFNTIWTGAGFAPWGRA